MSRMSGGVVAMAREDRARGRRHFDLIGFLAFVATGVGLVLRASGVYRASPIVFGYTTEEYLAAHAGRITSLWARAVLLAVGVLMIRRERPLIGTIVSGAGVICTALAFMFPNLGERFLAFLLLAPLAFFFSFAACWSKEEPPRDTPTE